MESRPVAVAVDDDDDDDDDEEKPSAINNFQIPFDLFVTKKHKKGFINRSYIKFTDSSGNLVFKSERPANNEDLKSISTYQSVKVILDASGDALISIHKLKVGLFNAFKVNDGREELLLRAEKTMDQFTRVEFDVSLHSENVLDSETNLKMRGCPFKRSCTIYKGNAILAESSLMYQLGIKKAFVPRSRFRVTLFPGCNDHVLVVALVVIFFNGTNLWI